MTARDDHPAGPARFDAFDDGKEPGALRTIGEVSRALGIRQHVLRYWEEHFPALRPVKRGGGRRYYRPADVELIRAIDGLIHRQGYTLKGARAHLMAKAPPADAPDPETELLAELSRLRARLARALAEA